MVQFFPAVHTYIIFLLKFKVSQRKTMQFLTKLIMILIFKYGNIALPSFCFLEHCRSLHLLPILLLMQSSWSKNAMFLMLFDKRAYNVLNRSSFFKGNRILSCEGI